MKITIFQKAYDAIKSWQPPQWLKIILQGINDLMIALLKKTGQAYIQYLQTEIIYAASQNWTPGEKADYVFNQAKKGFVSFAITLKDSEVNLLIEQLVNLLKSQNVIK